MLRVVLLAVAAVSLGLGACSMNTAGLSSGFAQSDTASSTSTGSLGGSRSARSSLTGSGTQVAALNPDMAPSGTYEKAPRGALADRADAPAVDREMDARTAIGKPCVGQHRLMRHSSVPATGCASARA